MVKIEILKATIEQKPILANLLELYAYDFTEFFDFDIGSNGYYGYANLPLYWKEPNRHPFLIYVEGKLAGFVLLKRDLLFQKIKIFLMWRNFLL